MLWTFSWQCLGVGDDRCLQCLESCPRGILGSVRGARVWMDGWSGTIDSCSLEYLKIMPKFLLEIKTKKNRGALLVKSQKCSWSNLYIISYLLLCCQNYSQVPFAAPSAKGKVHDLNGFKWGEERDQESWNKMRVARDPESPEGKNMKVIVNIDRLHWYH